MERLPKAHIVEFETTVGKLTTNSSEAPAKHANSVWHMHCFIRAPSPIAVRWSSGRTWRALPRVWSAPTICRAAILKEARRELGSAGQTLMRSRIIFCGATPIALVASSAAKAFWRHECRDGFDSAVTSVCDSAGGHNQPDQQLSHRKVWPELPLWCGPRGRTMVRRAAVCEISRQRTGPVPLRGSISHFSSLPGTYQ